jgi:rhodanese-related sulfurtransferase
MRNLTTANCSAEALAASERRATAWVAVVLLTMAGSCAQTHMGVTPKQAKELIDSTDRLVVLDVREVSEYCDPAGHIPGALNYPWNSGILQARYAELPADSPILVVCRRGRRSNRAASFLGTRRSSQIYDMRGGMRAWPWETARCADSDGHGTDDDRDSTTR